MNVRAIRMRLACAALMLGAAAPPPALPAPVVIRHQDVPLITIYAWERWGNFINALAGSKTEIPYDAARLQVKVYTFPTGEIRAIRFGNGVRTHRHINQTDTILYSWQAHRVQFVDDKAVVTGPGDFALHQKGVNHSGEEIRRGGGIDLEFAMTIAGRHNDPAAWWSLARDHAVQPAASWLKDGRTVEAIGPDAASAPSGAAHYQVRVAALPHFGARELYLAKGSILPSRDMTTDRLFFLLSGHVKLTTAGKSYLLEPEDSARAIKGADFTLEALDDAMFAEAFVPAAN